MNKQEEFLFKYQYTHGEDLVSIVKRDNSIIQLDDVLETFESFLKAVGFHIDGNIEVVKED